MAKKPSIKTIDIEKYADLDLHQLEEELAKVQQLPASSETQKSTRAIHQAIRTRQRQIKAAVMEFEQSNDHHLLIFDSTDGFSKIAGRSVLFYTMTIADRVRRRFSVKNDTDGYSRSEDGIVSVRSLDQLEAQLAEINIFPDRDLTTSELHFYKLAKVYTDEQVDRLRDQSRQDIERITSIVVPKSPVPLLYTMILELSRLIYYNCKRISDPLARDTIARELLHGSCELTTNYLNFANAKPTASAVRQQLQNSLSSISGAGSAAAKASTSPQAQSLFNILLITRNLRNQMANVENLRLIHHRNICGILEKLVDIERLTAREYNRLTRNKTDEGATSTARTASASTASSASSTSKTTKSPAQSRAQEN